MTQLQLAALFRQLLQILVTYLAAKGFELPDIDIGTLSAAFASIAIVMWSVRQKKKDIENATLDGEAKAFVSTMKRSNPGYGKHER